MLKSMTWALPHADLNDHDIYLKKIELLRLQVELFSMQLQLDTRRLEDEKQIHELNYLIAATDPSLDDRSKKRFLSICI